MHGWAVIFGRLLVAWLQSGALGSIPDLIVAHPTFPGQLGYRAGHTERVLDAASAEDVLGEWPFDVGDPPVVVRVTPTEKSAKASAAGKRLAAAELRSALRVVDVERVEGSHVLIYDDVCTTGSQLNAVAECLITDGGASLVEAVVLARAPWRRWIGP
ncbi:MAG: ComF family protein [Acidimicrobiales bacterium]